MLKPYLCCGATQEVRMNTARNFQVLTERLGLAFSTALLAILPVAAALLLVESL